MYHENSPQEKCGYDLKKLLFSWRWIFRNGESQDSKYQLRMKEIEIRVIFCTLSRMILIFLILIFIDILQNQKLQEIN
jgi:hypothetical protein